MMESKAVIYTVIAVALGYLLISAVPDRLASLQRVTRPRGAEEMESVVVEEKESTESESRVAPDESISTLGDELTAEVSELEVSELEIAAPRGVWDGAIALGVWMINLIVALGVYFIVKRRLS